MANSAWSGNTAGLATAVSPGLVSTTAQTFGGDKTLTGLITASGGIVATGMTAANVTAVTTAGSGKAGEYKYTSSSLSGQSSGTNITGTNFITCGPGIWIVKVIGNVSAVAPVQFNVAVAFTQNGTPVNSTTGMLSTASFLDTGNINDAMSMISSDNYFALTANQNMYPYVYVNKPTSSSYGIGLSIQAYRIF